MPRRHIAGLEMHLRRAQIVARNETVKNLRQKPPLLRLQSPHDSEIDRDQPAVVIDEQIARMHVGVEKAIAQRMTQESLDHRASKLRQIEAFLLEFRAVGKWRAVD